MFDEIKQSLILDPFDLNVTNLITGTKNQKSKYMLRFNISTNPKNSIVVDNQTKV